MKELSRRMVKVNEGGVIWSGGEGSREGAVYMRVLESANVS